MADIKKLVGEKVIDKDGKEYDVVDLCKDKKAIGIYFSAHWCPPCRGFTPVLAEFYDSIKDKFVVIFVSSDRDEAGFKEYLQEMPWYAVPYGDRETKSALSAKYGVRGIPTLVILKPDGSTIEDNGRGTVTNKAKDKTFPSNWE